MLQQLQENSCAQVPFCNKVTQRRHVASSKIDYSNMFSCKFCKIFKKHYFEEHLKTAASDNSSWSKIFNSYAFKDTHREKSPSNIIPACAESMNMDNWVVGTSKQLFW